MKRYNRFIVEDLDGSVNSEDKNYRILKGEEDFEEESEKTSDPENPSDNELSPDIEKSMDSEIEPGDEETD